MTEVSLRLNGALADRYAIEREIGSGGMAIVYLAKDLRHNRNVALKVLRPELGAVLGVERFLAEIQVTANLQHPNLLPLFDSGAADGHLFYVMPYVQGESLRKRLDREKQLPVSDALHIAVSVASALDYAHRHGVIHRDLKPENILLQDGEPLIADFGIALAVSNAGGGRITQTGLSLGTPQYMSPEQATGDRDVDGRADIYSLAAVTYEMLVGEAPHTGSTSQAIIARVLTERPRSVRSTRPSVPEHVEAAIAQGLEKLPADRFGSAREFADAVSGRTQVRRPFEGESSRAAVPRMPAGRENLLRVGLVALGLSVGAVGVAIARPGIEGRPVRFTVETPRTPAWNSVAISPDGARIAFAAPADPGAPGVLWIRPLDQLTARPLPGTEGARLPFWSPDSREVAYFDGSRLRKVDIDGGVPQTLTEIPNFRGGAWSPEGVILLASAGGLQTIPASGGTAVRVPFPDSAAYEASSPTFLPDGRRFLFSTWNVVPEERGVFASSLDGDVPVAVVQPHSTVRYAPPGFLLIHREGALMAQPFDADRLRITGDPVPVAAEVLTDVVSGQSAFDVSRDGTIVFRPGVFGDATELEWFSRDGRSLGVAGEVGPWNRVDLSPDDRYVALRRNEPNPDIWTLDLESGIPSRLTFAGTPNDPVWFPDSRTVTYWSALGGSSLRSTTIGATRDSALLVAPQTGLWSGDVSRDGRFLLYRTGLGQKSRLMALPLEPGGQPIALSDQAFGKREGRFSPDGRWISYGSDESTAWEVYVASFPAFANVRQVSRGGGGQARWRADGRELFYLAPTGDVMSVKVTPGETLQLAPPVPLFRAPLMDPMEPNTFDVTSDGERFLFLVRKQSGSNPLTVVLNWQSGLGR